MAQKPQIVDLNRSYMPGDPNAFPSNLISTEREDGEEKTNPVILYEGYNFMPTSYGYRSYFGLNSKLDIDTLPARCDKMVVYQLANLKNIIIALCEDGLYYTDSTTVAGANWIKGITLTLPAVGTYKEWTYCVIENVFYVYRQGEPSYWKIDPTAYSVSGVPAAITLTITPIVPTFLNMAGQLGIFRANASLAFWDSANSIGWSSPLALQDFTPSLTTLAGNAIFSGVLGKIITIKSQGDNFIIYTTRGIVGVRYISTSTVLWEATTITDSAGIASSKCVTTGQTELEHFAYTNTGIKKIGSYNALNKAHAFEEILTEVYDLLRENNETVALDFLNSRYLFISLLNSDYINGRVTFELDTITETLLEITINGITWNGTDALPIDINGTAFGQKLSTDIALGNTSGTFAQWHASGTGSFSMVTTPMHHFLRDTGGNPLPQTIHSKALFSTAGVTADTANLSLYVGMASPTFPKEDVALNYSSYNTLHVGVMGAIDGGFPAFIAAQHAEWTNFKVIQSANRAQLEGILPGTPQVTLGTEASLEDGAILIAEALKAFAASKPGSVVAGDSVTYDDYDAGDFLSGDGIAAEAFVQGVGTAYPTFLQTMNFSGGYRVKRKKVRTFMADRVGPVRSGWTYYVVGGSIGDWVSALAAAGGNTGYIWRSRDTKEQVTNALNAVMAGLGSMVPSYSEFGSPSYLVGVVGPGGAGLMTDGYGLMYNCIPRGGYRAVMSHAPSSYFSINRATHYLDYSEMAFIEVTNTAKTGSSTLSASQSGITWGIADSLNLPAHPYGATHSADFSLFLPGGTFGYTFPGSTFLLQDGSVAPIYPTYVGALVLDIALKKWGKMKADYKALIDYSVINAVSDITPYSNLGVDGAVLKADGFAYHMDAKPLDSYIKYGKIGFFRKGYTGVEEVKIVFRMPFTGDVVIDTSVHGAVVEPTLQQLTSYTGVISLTCSGGYDGRWHTIKISGNYDVQYLEFRGTITGRR